MEYIEKAYKAFEDIIRNANEGDLSADINDEINAAFRDSVMKFGECLCDAQ